MQHHKFFLFIVFFLFFLSGCAVTVHRELLHRDFSVFYPNWDDYQLEKYEDNTFKVVTTNHDNTCRVLVSSYTTDYLSVAKILLEAVQQTPEYQLLNKTIKYNFAFLEYLVTNSPTERVDIYVSQCGDFAYVIQYACAEEIYADYARSIKTVATSVKCNAPFEYVVY